MKKNTLGFFITALPIFIIYRTVFSFLPVSAGDYIRITSSQLFTWQFFSFDIWNTNLNLGWGIIPLLSYAPYSFLIGWIGELARGNGIVVERIVWWMPYLIAGFISSWLLFKKLFGNSFFSYLVPFLYLCNTYILLIVGGGQIAGIGQAYALAPLIILSYIFLVGKPSLSRSILTGAALAISLMLDLRMTYVVLVGVGVYLFVKAISELRIASYESKDLFKNIALIIIVPGAIAVLLQAYWLIPMAIVRQNPLQQLGSAYDSTAAVRFFSFATFENTLGMLHPNWPENIFGKVGFMKPEFLVLPILAYGALLFLKPFDSLHSLREKREQVYILFFALLGLVGTFLAKGANDPLGGVYVWMFGHIPGFIMFRDPTKWYLLVAISYSMLIPYAISRIYAWLVEKTRSK